MFIGGNQKSGSAAGGIKDRFIFFRVNNFNNKINNMPWSPELSCVSLRTKYRKQIFIGVAEFFAMFVGKVVDLFQKQIERFGIAVRQESIFKNVSEKLREVGVLRHFEQSFRVEIEP